MNKDFVIYDAQGQILRTGSVPPEAFDAQVQEGEFIVEGKACCKNDAVDPATGEIIIDGRPNPPVAVPPPAPPAAPMPVEQQLDLLWQAMDAGTFPKAEPFYSAIKAAKGE